MLPLYCVHKKSGGIIENFLPINHQIVLFEENTECITFPKKIYDLRFFNCHQPASYCISNVFYISKLEDLNLIIKPKKDPTDVLFSCFHNIKCSNGISNIEL